jgi:hypothetical protein
MTALRGCPAGRRTGKPNLHSHRCTILIDKSVYSQKTRRLQVVRTNHAGAAPAAFKSAGEEVLRTTPKNDTI